MAFLYKITNTITNKCYIGWTSKTVDQRWNQHITDALNFRDNRKFYNAIRKYGKDSWQIETLSEVESNDEAKTKEIELIEQFQSYSRGYNATRGGDGNNGIIMSLESNEARSRALKGIPKNYDRMKGKSHSEETKEKISKAHKGMKKPWVNHTKEQIFKRALTRRALTKETFDVLKNLVSLGLTNKEIANHLNIKVATIKKWRHRDWNLN